MGLRCIAATSRSWPWRRAYLDPVQALQRDGMVGSTQGPPCYGSSLLTNIPTHPAHHPQRDRAARRILTPQAQGHIPDLNASPHHQWKPNPVPSIKKRATPLQNRFLFGTSLFIRLIIQTGRHNAFQHGVPCRKGALSFLSLITHLAYKLIWHREPNIPPPVFPTVSLFPCLHLNFYSTSSPSSNVLLGRVLPCRTIWVAEMLKVGHVARSRWLTVVNYVGW